MSEGDWHDYHHEPTAEEGMGLPQPDRTRDTIPVQSPIRFALAIPTCADWMPERAAGLDRVKRQLGHRPQWYREFRDREPNRVWSQKLWRWAVETGATHLVQLQDDALVSPNFWPAVRAMVEAVPEQIIGLEAAHPAGPELGRIGHHWYRTRAWLVGVGYVFPVTVLREFLAWCDEYPEKVGRENEDTLVNVWCGEVGRDVWHPIPTVIDHDLSAASTYANDGHQHRKPTVTWHGYGEQIASTDYWRVSQEPPLVPMPFSHQCWFCGSEPGLVKGPMYEARIGKVCLIKAVGAAMGLNLETKR